MTRQRTTEGDLRAFAVYQKKMVRKTLRRVSVGKYLGDDAYSWAVFVDGRPVATGCSRSEASYHRRHIERRLLSESGVPETEWPR